MGKDRSAYLAGLLDVTKNQMGYAFAAAIDKNVTHHRWDGRLSACAEARYAIANICRCTQLRLVLCRSLTEGSTHVGAFAK